MYYSLPPITYKGVCNVQHNFNFYFDMLTNKCCNLFVWDGLPDTVDQRALNLSLVLGGKVCWTKFNDKLYALNGNIGGEPNAYYEPQLFIIANPVLGSKQVRIRQKDGSKDVQGLDGILMGNSDVDVMSDRPTGGLFGLIYQTAGLLADNVSSLNTSQINGRVAQIWTADTDAMARTAEFVLRDIYDGRPYKVVTQDILDKVGVLAAAKEGQANTLLNLIEAHRSILQDFYNELGIGYQGNSKRERVNTAEVGLMRGCLDVNIENMLKNRQEAVERINELFGTSISVEINPELFYEGSGNATLGEEIPEEEIQEKPDSAIDSAATDDSDSTDEKNTEEIIKEQEERGEEKEESTQGKRGEDE